MQTIYVRCFGETRETISEKISDVTDSSIEVVYELGSDSKVYERSTMTDEEIINAVYTAAERYQKEMKQVGAANNAKHPELAVLDAKLEELRKS